LPGWRNGIREGLKIPWSQGLVGSSPTPGTLIYRCGLKMGVWGGCVINQLLIRLRSYDRFETNKNMIWTIVVTLLVLWLLGFSFSVGGNLIHTLLLVALIVIVVRFLS
jgi:hypothetical protein